MNDTILTPGGDHWEPTSEPLNNPEYLEKDNYLSEYDTEETKSVVRENLGVYNKDSVYTKLESDIKLDETIKKAFEKYLNEDDPHGLIPKVEQMLTGFVREDGSTPFLAPQQGVDPVKDFHLTTKRFVNKVLRDHISDEDPHLIIPKVENILNLYVKSADIYFQSLLYTKDEIDSQSGKYIKKDGSTAFTRPLLGIDPLIDSHLTTKRYVDKVIYQHLVDVDPHGFVSLLNNRLASYAKANNVYDKSQTYSRIQLDSIIRSLVGDAAEEAIQDHLNLFDPHHILAEVRKENYIKQDGSTTFKAPQSGVEAVKDNDFVILSLLKEALAKFPEKEWITSGPIESTVGYVEKGTKVPETMTFQEIMDAIFYGKTVTISAPDYVTMGESVPITICIHGSIALIESIELLKNGEFEAALSKEDFEDGCVTIDTSPIDRDSEYTVRVVYSNGAEHEESVIVKCGYPVFIGLLPKWKFGNTITMDYLNELKTEEPNNNLFIKEFGPDTESAVITYNFLDSLLRHPFVVTPVAYPSLTSMTTAAQSFSIEAFDVIDQIPLLVGGKDVIYKIYIYRLALSSLNQKVTFNF